MFGFSLVMCEFSLVMCEFSVVTVFVELDFSHNIIMTLDLT
jgi:hypothetical protein